MRRKRWKEDRSTSRRSGKKKAIYANRQTDIKINQEYLDKLGLSVPEEPVEDLAEEPVEKPVEKPVGKTKEAVAEAGDSGTGYGRR